MTGEWNISSRSEIQATNQRRRAEYEGWQGVIAAELLIGEREAVAGEKIVPTGLIGGLRQVGQGAILPDTV
jgi:hypothetical protein